MAAWIIYSGISASGGLVSTVEYLPVAAWFIRNISNNGGFVNTWLSLYTVEYVSGGLVYS